MRSLLLRGLQRSVTGPNRAVRVATYSTYATLEERYGFRLEKIPPIVLRDACKCSRCVDQSTKQREFLFSDIPVDIVALPEQDENTDDWVVKWINDIPGYEDHVSMFTSQQIEKITKPVASDYRPVTMLWDKSKFARETQKVKYDDFMHDQMALAKVLWLFRRHGLVFLTDVPQEPKSVNKIAKRMGQLRTTFYGKTWNVQSVPQAKNVAYTSKYLGFHMDLLYMKESPGAQLLHCLENTSVGGESRFVDTFKAYDLLLSEQPIHAVWLRSAKIRYEYDNDGFYFSNTKPVIQFRGHDDAPRHRLMGANSSRKILNELDRIYWSPPFVGSILTVPRADRVTLRQTIKATKAFADMLERDKLVYETKMEAGTCVIFNNLRVVHARNAFDMNSGSRWLRGAYLDTQDMVSAELALKKEIMELESKIH